jgi:hypothetical protein
MLARARSPPSTYRAMHLGESGHVNEQIWAKYVENLDAFREYANTRRWP